MAEEKKEKSKPGFTEESWKGLSKYLLILLFVGLVYASFLMLKPFFTVFVISLVTTYLFMPLYKAIKTVFRSPRLSSLITCSIILIVAILVLTMLVSALTYEALNVYSTVTSQGFDDQVRIKVKSGYDFLSKYVKTSPALATLLESSKESAGEYATNAAQRIIDALISIISGLGKIILGIGIMVLMVFYFFKDGKAIIQKIKAASPLPPKHTDYVIDQLDKTMNTLSFSIVFVAIGIGVLSLIGFLLFGITPAFTLALLTTLASIMPAGMAIVWVPVIIYYLITVGLTGTEGLIKTGLLAAYAFLVVGSTDNVIRFIMASRSVSIHPLLIIIGLIGGVMLFGISGFIVGPVLLVLVISLITTAYERPENGKPLSQHITQKVKGWFKKIA